MSHHSRMERVFYGSPMRSWNSYLEQAQYNYFNPNGAVQQAAQLMDTLFQHVDAGNINSGWLLAHNGDYHRQAIIKLTQKQRVRGRDIRYHVEALRIERDAVYTQLGEVLLGLRGKNGRLIGETK